MSPLMNADVASVTLGGVAATYTVDSLNQITATVPAGVPGGKGRWRVTTSAGSAESPQFTVAVAFADGIDCNGCGHQLSDITQVGVHDDSTNVVTFYVTETNGSPSNNLNLDVYLDTDRNPGTGQNGFDRRIRVSGGGVLHLRGWNGTAFATVLPQTTLTSTWLVRAEIKINRSELGATGAGFDFAVMTEFWDEPNQTGDHFDDRAPDSPLRAWSYDFGSA